MRNALRTLIFPLILSTLTVSAEHVTTSTQPISPSSVSLISPLEGAAIVKPYGVSLDPVYHVRVFNESMTLKPSIPGSPVRTIAEGTVIFTGGKSATVVIQHANGLYSAYSHLSKIAPTIHNGTTLPQGTTIGHVTNELTLLISRNNQPVDPALLIAF